MEVNSARPRPEYLATSQISGGGAGNSVAPTMPASTGETVTLSQDALALLDAEQSATTQSGLESGATVTPFSTGITPPPPPPPPEDPEKEN